MVPQDAFGSWTPRPKKLSADCYHMLKSCNSLSEYTAYANGLACLNLRLVSLNQYLDDLLRHLQMIVRRTGVRLEYTLPDESVELYLDTDKLVIVLTSVFTDMIPSMPITEDVLLICPRSEEQNIKKYIDEVKFNKGEEYI